MISYDPNLTELGNMAVQTVELTFQQWEYKAIKTTTVSGNCTGLDVIRGAIDRVYAELARAEQIILTDPEGKTLACELWETRLDDLLVSARITSIVAARDSDGLADAKVDQGIK